MKSYECFLGVSESYKHTMEAKDFESLKEKIGNAWITFKNGNWIEQKIDNPNELPKGARRFVIEDAITYPSLGNCKSYILIIPERCFDDSI